MLRGCWALLSGAFAIGSAASVRPNLILIVADDLGYSDVGWKNANVRTPTLDGLVGRTIWLISGQ
jgi:arylsulfatase